MKRSDVSLGIRLALAGGRESTARLVITTAGVVLGVALLLVVGAVQSALHQRNVRTEWHEPDGQPLDAGDPDGEGLLWRPSEDRFDGQEISRFDVAALGPDAPVPPGLERLPGPGEVAVSPALAELMRTSPANQLSDRYGDGEITTVVDDAGLENPDELVVVVGWDPAELAEYPEVQVVDSFDNDGAAPSRSPLLYVLLVVGSLAVLLPVGVLVATATRLAAAQREQRLATLWLVGASPAQTRRVAAAEGGLVGLVGAVVGWGLFTLLQPAIARLPLSPFDGSHFFAQDLRPSAAVVAAVLLLTPLVAAAAAVVSLRRLDISPLGVSRRAPGGPPSLWRALPLAVSLPTFAGALWMVREQDLEDGTAGVIVGVGFAFVVAGIVVAGPLLVRATAAWLARHARGPASLMAARRLAADPRAGYRAIGGVVLAVFMASLFFGLRPTIVAGESSGMINGYRPRDETVLIFTGYVDDAAAYAELRDALADIPGAGRPVEVTWRAARIAGAPSFVVVASCEDMSTVVDLGGIRQCPDAQLLTADGRDPGPIELLSQEPGKAAGDVVATVAAPDSVAQVDSSILGLADVLIDPSLMPSGEGQGSLFVPTDGSMRTLEEIRTATAGFVPGDVVLGGQETRVEVSREVRHVSRAITLALLATLLVAGCSVAVAAIGGLLERRRPFALLRLTGAPLRTLRAVVLREAALPLLTLATASSALGLAVGWMIVHFTAGDTRYEPPSVALVAVLAAGLAVALAVVASILPLLDRVTRTETTRFE